MEICEIVRLGYGECETSFDCIVIGAVLPGWEYAWVIARQAWLDCGVLELASPWADGLGSKGRIRYLLQEPMLTRIRTQPSLHLRTPETFERRNSGDELSPITRKWTLSYLSWMTSSEGLMQCAAVCCPIFISPPRRLHSPYKFYAISGSSLEHSLHLPVRGLICRRQRHRLRRHTELLEPSFKPGRSEQNEHPAIL